MEPAYEDTPSDLEEEAQAAAEDAAHAEADAEFEPEADFEPEPPRKQARFPDQPSALMQHWCLNESPTRLRTAVGWQ